jgi:1-acyl-sn-glycerol-3-phosphate acyltransferase
LGSGDVARKLTQMAANAIGAGDKARSLLFQIWFWLYTIPMNLVWLPSLVLPRPFIRTGLEWWCGLTMWGLRVFAGVRYEVRGRENILASKHQSMWETIAYNVILKDPAVIIKRELASLPFYGWYAVKQESIFVDREAHASALKQMVADAKKRLADGRPVVIFPEGTRKLPGEAPDYKPGVAALYNQLGVPCVPVALNSGRHWLKSGPWRKPGVIVVEFLPAIPPGLKRPEFMRQLQETTEAATAKLSAA